MLYLRKIKNMKTLIIHPQDRSTDFLKPIYQDIENKTVVTGDVSRKEIREMIKQYDRTIMLGHGGPAGLFSVGKFDVGMIIDYTMVDLLKQQDNNIYIWCNADQFVRRHNLKGIYSGMFISEVEEGEYCLARTYPQVLVDTSNDTFAQALGEALVMENSTGGIFENMMIEYSTLTDDNAIADYNFQRLYLAL
jgi:hypothetical protein